MPATRFNGYMVGDGAPGPVVQRLLQAWSERVGVDIVARAKAAVLRPTYA
jgi:branched-chain amino acid aminotransferase